MQNRLLLPEFYLKEQRGIEDQRVVVDGIDTHEDTHSAAVTDEQDRVLASQTYQPTCYVCKQMLTWLRSFRLPARVTVECTGKYGAGLLCHLQFDSVDMLEVTARINMIVASRDRRHESCGNADLRRSRMCGL